MKTHYLILPLLCLVLSWSKPVYAALITTDIIYVTDNIWEYHYTIENDTAASIEQFAMYFPSDLYQDLVDISTLPDWDILLFQPGAFFPSDDGIFDALALVQGINPGEILTGFAVRFSFLGSGNLGGQDFEIYDPANFEIGPIDAGVTPTIALPRAVPIAASGWLFALGTILVLFTLRRRFKIQTS